jgi:hypothetical protein
MKEHGIWTIIPGCQSVTVNLNRRTNLPLKVILEATKITEKNPKKNNEQGNRDKVPGMTA